MSIHEFDPAQHVAAVPPTRRPGPARSDTPALAGPAALGARGLLRLQRQAGNAAVTGLLEEERSPVLDVVGRGGSPMEAGLRQDMETRLGADFSDVRFHVDSAGHDSARAVGAHAYTVGRDVVFQRDAFDPASQPGRTTIAHELTHVMQQRSGPVAGTDAGNGVAISDPGDAFERAAAANAETAMSLQREDEGLEDELEEM